MSYQRIASRLFNTPLLMTSSKAEIIASVVIARIGGDAVSQHEVEEEPRVIYASLPPVRGSAAQSPSTGRIAVINIDGTLVHKSGGMKAMSGLRSYVDISEDVQAAADDQTVHGILLRVDSPGGEVNGAFDTADVIYAAARKKPVWSIAEDNALSSGYLLASQASKLYITQSALIGSVGVVMLHHDLSQAQEKAGVRVTTLYRGARKADLSPNAPLSKEARDRAEELLSGYYEKFVSAVARGRKIGAQAVRDTQAGIYMGDKAMSIGLADGIGSYRDVVSRFAATLAGNGKASTEPAGFRPAEAQAIRAEVLAHAASIARLCDFAGQPSLAGEFIREGKSRVEVVTELKKLQAAERTMSRRPN